MKAITCSGYGAPEDVLRLADVPEPDLADDGVLVEVHAASLNPADWHLIRGVPYLARLTIGLRRPGFRVPGSDFAGRVVARGSEVTDFDEGDDVFGTTFMDGFGTFAERVALPAHLLARKPAHVSFDDAAATPLAAMTALQALRDHGRIEPGRRVLIIGASGGVGTFAVQIARSLGAEVTGVCSTNNVDLVRSLGADHVIDYTAPGAWDDPGHHDLILQAGGTQAASELRRMLEPDGTLVQISGDSDNRWFGPFGRVVGGQLLSRFVRQTITTFTVHPNRADLDHIADLLAAGRVRPVIATTVPFEQMHDAIAQVESGHTRGKVVVRRGVATESRTFSDEIDAVGRAAVDHILAVTRHRQAPAPSPAWRQQPKPTARPEGAAERTSCPDRRSATGSA